MSSVLSGLVIFSCSTSQVSAEGETTETTAEASPSPQASPPAQAKAPEQAEAPEQAPAPVTVGEGFGSPDSPLPTKKHEDEDRGIAVELTPSQAPDGGMVFVKVRVDSKKAKGLTAQKVLITFEGAKFPAFEMGAGEYGALVAIPFNSNPRQSKVEVEIPGAEALKLGFEVIDGKYRSEILTVDPKYSSPPQKALKRIVREMKEIGAIYRKTSDERLWKGRFQLPVDSVQTSPFGNKRVFNGELKSFHQGLDLRAKVGTPIVAPEGGRVVLAKNLYFTGNCVILDHGHGLYTLYAHLSKLQVKNGQVVKKGQRLGLAGATGRASGPHLHWGAVLKGAKVNPLDLTRVIP